MKVFGAIQFLFISGIILFSACDQLGIDPNVNVDDCLTQKDRDNYKNLIANEMATTAIIELYEGDPELVPETERQSVYDELTSLNTLHDEYRTKFECQYWGEDNDILVGISEESKDQVDVSFLDPALYKGLFKVDANNVLTAINQEDWIGKEVYVFPGISRIPWENASQASKEKALEKINVAYNDVRTELGETGSKELFDPINDYVFPHATYHQVFVSQFAGAIINQNNEPLKQLVADMKTVEMNVITKFIKRAPAEL